MRAVAVIGAGGHGKVVVATLQAAGRTVMGVFDDAAHARGTEILGVKVLGPVAAVAEVDADVVVAIGSNPVRKKVVAGLIGARFATAVHPTAIVHPSVEIGEGTVVFAGAVIQPSTRIGRHAIVNTGAAVDHDCVLGDYVHVAPRTALAGAVRLGEGVFLGIATAVIPGIEIGPWTTVGAGAAVVRDLPGGITAVGVPAKQRS